MRAGVPHRRPPGSPEEGSPAYVSTPSRSEQSRGPGQPRAFPMDVSLNPGCCPLTLPVPTAPSTGPLCPGAWSPRVTFQAPFWSLPVRVWASLLPVTTPHPILGPRSSPQGKLFTWPLLPRAPGPSPSLHPLSQGRLCAGEDISPGFLPEAPGFPAPALMDNPAVCLLSVESCPHTGLHLRSADKETEPRTGFG